MKRLMKSQQHLWHQLKNNNMSWGTKTVLIIVIFIAGMMSLVFISMSQKIDLVTENYYEKDLVYQNEIDKINNTSELSENPEFIKSPGTLRIEFPANSIPDSGRVIFYKPSDDKQDKTFDLITDGNKSIEFNLNEYSNGFWRIKLYWSYNGQDFKIEDSFFN